MPAFFESNIYLLRPSRLELPEPIGGIVGDIRRGACAGVIGGTRGVGITGVIRGARGVGITGVIGGTRSIRIAGVVGRTQRACIPGVSRRADITGIVAGAASRRCRTARNCHIVSGGR